MSLLLLFPGVVATGTSTTPASCPLVVATTPTAWTIGHYDFPNIWEEWASYTWAQIASSGFTWAVMAGYTYTVVSTGSQSWSVVSVSTCPAVT